MTRYLPHAMTLTVGDSELEVWVGLDLEGIDYDFADTRLMKESAIAPVDRAKIQITEWQTVEHEDVPIVLQKLGISEAKVF